MLGRNGKWLPPAPIHGWLSILGQGSIALAIGAFEPGKGVFLEEASKYHVLPMDDRVFERLDAVSVGRPDLMGSRTSLSLAEGMTGMMVGVFVNVKNCSSTITAELEVPQGTANGTILAQGGLGTLYVNGEKVGEGRIENTRAGMFSADETADVGIDPGTPVVKSIGSEARSKFNGHIPKVAVEASAIRPGQTAQAEQAGATAAVKRALAD